MRNNKPSFRWATDIWQSSATTDTIYLIMEIGTLQGFAVDTGVRGHVLSSRARERLGRTSMPGGCPSVSCCDQTRRKVVACGAWQVEPATLRSWERSRGNAGPGMCLNGKGLCLERRRKKEGSPGATGCSIRGKRTGRETPEIQDLLLVPEQ